SRTAACAAVLLLAGLSAQAAAQDESAYVYASYYQCVPGQQEQAVELLRDSWRPIVRKHMDAGD
ncbi:MAG: hypothetical protein GWO36_16470, partial [Gemmatimonadetes bacterium]|nr:hypothetical protein [Gemmatimonadota bacterium]NIX40687.1 hypothetical protein [Gemmatimonadota bacterium]